MRIIYLLPVYPLRSPNKSEILMPTVLRAGKYRFFFFSNEGFERQHIHVESGDNHAKFWLGPIDLAKSVGYNERELSQIRELVLKNVKYFKEKWDAYFYF